MNSDIPDAAFGSGESTGEPTRGQCMLDDKILLGKLKRARVHAMALQDGVMRKSRKAVVHADEAVRHYPYRAVGIAAAIALLAGFLARRR